jgi:hypothetical protein
MIQARRFLMTRWMQFGAAAVCLALVSPAALPADNTKVLIGSWSGKATGPQGGPPTGDITVTIEKDPAGLKGTIVVKGSGTLQYSGQVSRIALTRGVFSATAVFKLGENPLEVEVTGPLKGKKIEGTFSVLTKGQKMGEGTFAITKDPARKPAK